jgi:hypothetical protein
MNVNLSKFMKISTEDFLDKEEIRFLSAQTFLIFNANVEWTEWKEK